MSESSTAAPASLRQTQQWLASVILHPETLDDPAFRGAVSAVVAVEPCDRAIERLRAYTGGLPARIFEALSQDHPALEHVVGASAFHDLVHRYLVHVPTGVYNLNDVASKLPEFLVSDELTVAYPFAADLARLERAVRIAFHARERSPLDAAALADWTMEDWSVAVIRFQPSVALVVAPWPIRDIWAARNTPRKDIDIVLEGRSDRVLVHRSAYDVSCESIADDEVWALERLHAGLTLGEVTEGLIELGGDPARVGAWFGRWHELGLITACETTRHDDMRATSRS